MITAADTNVLLDILNPDEPHKESSELALLTALREGTVVISEAVLAELAMHLSSEDEPQRFLDRTGLQLYHSEAPALKEAGQRWAKYARRRPRRFQCNQCGASQTIQCKGCGSPIRTRQHIIADFLIGAHALVQADRLLTRDRGFYGTYFPDLALA